MLKEKIALKGKRVLSSVECINADGKYFFENLEENQNTWWYFCSLLDRNGECVSLQCLVLPSLVFVPGFNVSVVIPEESRRALLCSSRTSPHIRKQLGLRVQVNESC